MAAQFKWTKWTQALRLVSWNADDVCDKKQELDHFLAQHGIDIRLLTEKQLRSGEVFRLANCHRNDQLSEGAEQQYWSVAV